MGVTVPRPKGAVSLLAPEVRQIMAEKETENVSSTSVGKCALANIQKSSFCALPYFSNAGSIKNVTSTPFVPRDHVSSAPLDGSIFEPAVPPSANSLCEMSSIAELSESSPAGTSIAQNIDTSNLDSEVSSSIKDPSVGDEKSSTLDRGFCASSLADSNIASQSSSSPHSSSTGDPSSAGGQSGVKETSEESVKDEEKLIKDKKLVEELVDVNEADKSVVEDSEEPLEVTESSKERVTETGEKLLRVTEPSKEGMNKADQMVPESRVEDGDKKPLEVPESSNEGCNENQVSASTAQEEHSCAAGQGMHSTAASAGVEESMSVDGDLSASNLSSIYLEDKMVTTSKVQTAPKRTRLTMVSMLSLFPFSLAHCRLGKYFQKIVYYSETPSNPSI